MPSLAALGSCTDEVTSASLLHEKGQDASQANVVGPTLATRSLERSGEVTDSPERRL